MEINSQLETELPVLELVDGTAEDIVSPYSMEGTSLTWQLGSDAFVHRHRCFLLAISALAFFLDSALYTGLAPVGPVFLYDNHTDIDAWYGLLFAAGPALTLITMPIGFSAAVRTGPLETLFPAFGILAVSALLMALASAVESTTRYAMVVVARGIAGVGMGLGRSSVPAVTASAHDNDAQRSGALSSALLGLGIGETLGPAYTGSLAAIKLPTGWSLAFFVLCGLAAGGCFLVLVAQRRLAEEGVHLRVPSTDYRPSARCLLKDEIIVVICLASLLAEMAVSLIPALIIPWVRSAFDLPPPWQLGLLMMAPNLSYLTATPLLILVHVPQARSRVILAVISLLLMSLSLFSLPFLPRLHILIALLPLAGLGVGAAVLDLCMLPVLSGHLVAEYSAKQNAVYKVQNFTLALAFTVGPLLGTGLAQEIGYDWTFLTFSMLLFVYTPWLCLLRAPHKERKDYKRLDYSS